VTRQVSPQLLALILLLPAISTAETPWDCTRQENGQWLCDSKLPLPQPESPATSSPDTSREAGETSAAPAMSETSETDRNSTLPESGNGGATGQETGAGMPDEAATVPREAGSEPGTAPAAATIIEPETAATTSPSETVAPRTAGDQPEPAAASPATGKVDDDDRWALCPPVARPAPLLETVALDTIDLRADSAQASEGDVYTLEGNAVAQYDKQRLEAEYLIYRQESGEIEAPHGVRYTGNGMYVSGESATLDTELQEGELRNVKYALYKQHGRGEADVLHLDGTAKQHLEDTYYTTCPPGKDSWKLAAREVDLDQEKGTGTAHHAKLYLKDVPVLYTPYARIPIDDRRMTGLLFPKIGQTKETGFDASLPFYWNIAPNRDMTIIPRYMSDVGTMLGAEFRYLNAHSRGTLAGDYLPSDDRRDGESRSLVSVRHYWTPVPRLRTSIVASNASDENYFEDLGTSLLQTSQTNLQRTAKAEYTGTWWDLGMMVQDFQTVDPDIRSAQRPYKQLPQLTFNAAPDTRLLGMKVETSAELNNFRHGDDSVVDGSRLDIQPRLSLPVYHAAWYVDPAVSLRHTIYNLDNMAPGTDNSPSRTLPVASLDAGTFFDRNGYWGERNYVQTLEPRLFYLYVPDKNQDDLPVFDTGDYDFNYWTLFRENRFSGPDRVGDANQLALSLTSRILDPASGRQIISASLGSLLYFSNRNVTLPGDPVETDKSSDLIGEATLALARNWNADTEIHWNPQDAKTTRNDYRLQYRPGRRQLVNLSYRQQSGLLKQTDMSFLWPLSPSWHVVGRWYYSLKSSETIEKLAGIGYETCCWQLQLLAQSYITNTEDDRNNSVFLQLELKGLGKLGTFVDDVLNRDILDYEAD
jgi:LPS-assembly protein